MTIKEYNSKYRKPIYLIMILILLYISGKTYFNIENNQYKKTITKKEKELDKTIEDKNYLNEYYKKNKRLYSNFKKYSIDNIEINKIRKYYSDILQQDLIDNTKKVFGYIHYIPRIQSVNKNTNCIEQLDIEIKLKKNINKLTNPIIDKMFVDYLNNFLKDINSYKKINLNKFILTIKIKDEWLKNEK